MSNCPACGSQWAIHVCQVNNTLRPPHSYPEPTIGLHVRRRDNGRVGFIRYIAKDGTKRTRPEHMFMVVGDVDVFIASTYCTSIVTHSSRFWESWDLVRCDRCKTNQCKHYVQLVDLGMSFALAARIAVTCHTGEKLRISSDDRDELREFEAKGVINECFGLTTILGLPLSVDWSRHDAESI